METEFQTQKKKKKKEDHYAAPASQYYLHKNKLCYTIDL